MIGNYGSPMSRVLREEAGAVSGGGGSLATDGGTDPTPPPADPPPADPPPIAAVADPVPPAVTLPDNWKEALSEELRADPSMANIVDIPGLAKSFVNAQKMVGRDKLVVPDKHATDEDWKGVFSKLGLPEKIEQYEVKNPEGAEFDDGVVSMLKQAAFGLNILPHQFEGLLKTFSDENNKALESQSSEMKTKTDEQVAGLKKDWGDAFKRNIQMVQSATKEAGESMKMNDLVKTFLVDNQVEGVRLGDHPTMVKLLHYFTQFMSEDQLPNVDLGGDEKTRAQVDQEVKGIIGNLDHPYHKRSHPNHANAVKHVETLMKKLHPEQAQQNIIGM